MYLQKLLDKDSSELLGKVKRSDESAEQCLLRLLNKEYQSIRGNATPVWLTAKEAARHVRLSAQTLTLKAKRGEIPSFRLGTSIRFLQSDLDDYLLQTRSASVEELKDAAAQKLSKGGK